MAPLFEAPEVHNQNVWKARKNVIFNNLVAQDSSLKKLSGEKKHKVIITGLIESVKRGFDNMPPKGMCDDCTDEDIRMVVEFMTS